MLGSALFVGSPLLLLWTLGTWGAGFRATLSPNMALVLANLVSNARDAMPAGGKVTISLDGIQLEGAAMARIQVADNGLGLPSVKALVEGDGGMVQVDSQPGRGCTFILLYPLAASEAD